jgi:hypothetical protein
VAVVGRKLAGPDGQSAASALHAAHADTLPARAPRRDFDRRGDEAAPDEAEPDEAEPSAAQGAPASGEALRGTPGTSQPGSVIAASLHPPFWPRY